MHIRQWFSVAWISQALAATPASGLDWTPLGKALSESALLILPGNSSFSSTAARWSSLDTPNPNAIVVPATEADVVQTLLFANEYDVPFLVSNGAHGSITTLGRMQSGIEIYMAGLNSISIANDSSTVTIGGGVMTKDLIDTLWDAGKQTVTGTCECVGYLGAALGGGHGWLQGHYGLISDQFVSARVVLGNGQIVEVSEDAADTATSDLLWGLRGAGHNFGIVTSVTARIYDLVAPQWALQTVVFAGSQVEQVYAVANALWLPDGVSTQQDGFAHWSYWYYDPTTDAAGPVVVLYLLQEGVETVDAAHVGPLEALGPLLSTATNGTYRDLAAWTGIDLASTPCQKTGNANPRFPVYLKAYNTSAMRAAYDLFAVATTEASSPFAGALFMFESYPQRAVQSLASDASAFAFRSDNILAAPLLSYTPNGTALEEHAHSLGNEIRNTLWAGRIDNPGPIHTYVNYAYGDETVEHWYGSDAARQQTLQRLKHRYDPCEQFSFYGPIPLGANSTFNESNMYSCSENNREATGQYDPFNRA